MKNVIVNPTPYWIYPRLYKYDYKEGEEVEMDFSGNEEGRNRAIVAPTGIQDTGLEFDQGNNQLVVYQLEMIF